MSQPRPNDPHTSRCAERRCDNDSGTEDCIHTRAARGTLTETQRAMLDRDACRTRLKQVDNIARVAIAEIRVCVAAMRDGAEGRFERQEKVADHLESLLGEEPL